MIPSVPYHNVVMKILSYSGFIGNKKIYPGVEPKYICGCVFFLYFIFFVDLMQGKTSLEQQRQLLCNPHLSP